VTTPLGKKIIDLIRINGPISVADYFALCLNDHEHGYYRTREPFGTQGDFTTAPEISQLFGELIGIFMIVAWQAHGKPDGVQLVEIGPGRGTLMADAQRVITGLSPDMAAVTTGNLVETSSRLQNIQRETLAGCALVNRWHGDLQSVQSGFTLLVANEFFDAIPIRQFANGPNGFCERVITISNDGDLVFSSGVARIDSALLPKDIAAKPGTVFETAPAREAIMKEIAGRLVSDGGTALLLDYGHLETAYGDTLQAIMNHRYDDVLASPGEADLTSHVDFDALGKAALAQNAHISDPLTQGQFLLGLGLLERAGALGSGKSPQVRQSIQQAVDRLAGDGENQMGSLFKALCVSGSEMSIPPFKTAD
jgi:SAM-dependent MidA family methyltransferase